jgi:Kef-type K+ transport system membrane component KefB
MFVVGLEFDPGLLRGRGRAALVISPAGIVAPFLLGVALAAGLYPILSTRDIPFVVFALFIGVSMSVTAFPVLARILVDRRLHDTDVGRIAIACAAIDDVTAWCLLVAVVGVARGGTSGAAGTLALTVIYVVAVFTLVRPLLVRLARSQEHRARPAAGALASVVAAVVVSAATTEWIGIHAIVGAFALGTMMPAPSRLARFLAEKVRRPAVTLLLPAFFAVTGMRTQIGLLRGLDQWLMCALIVVVACLGKFGGGLIAARLTGSGWRAAISLGVLMNMRGLMELIVLNIGLDLNIISPVLFTMLVLMALVTTFMTTPVLDALAFFGQSAWHRPRIVAERA